MRACMHVYTQGQDLRLVAPNVCDLTHERSGSVLGERQVLHFSSSPKPWEEAKRKGDLEMLWWQHFVQLQLQGLSTS